MRWSSEDLALRNRPLNQIPRIDWIRPGEGPRGRLCGSWRNYKCERGGEPLSAPAWCGRRDCPCPNCYRRWIDDTAQGILERFGVDELYVTIHVRETPDDVDTWKAQRRGVIDEAKAEGIAGGAIVQVVSSNVVRYFVLSREGQGRKVGLRQVRALLGRCSFPRGSQAHSVVWFGNLSYRGPKKAGFTFPLSNGPVVTGAKYPLRICCEEHGCDAVYVSTTMDPLGLPVETGPGRRHRRRRRP